jgi:hypothetical protein
MSVYFKKFSYSALLILLLNQISTPVACSQDVTDDPHAYQSLHFSATYAPTSFRAWGKMRNTRHLFLHIGMTHSEIELFSMRTQLGSDLALLGWIEYPSDGRNGPRESIYGIGMTPLFARIPLSDGHRFPYLTASTGFLVTSRHFPNGDGARFNFTLGTGMGYQFQIAQGTSIQIGYKLHHLSNGYRAHENPGIDSVLFFFNFLFHR